MNLKQLALIGIFLFNTTISYATTINTGFDTKKYNIADEDGFSVILYDYYNAVKLSMLGEKSNTPDQAGQIEAVRKRDELKVFDAETKAAYLRGKINMLQVKEKIINELNKQNINILKRNFTVEQINPILDILRNEEEKVIAQIRQKKGLPFIEGVIYYLIFNPFINKNVFPDNMSLPMINSAILIAVTRADNEYWFNDILNCANQDDTDNTVDYNSKAIDCAGKYFSAITQEALKTAREMESLRPMYNRMRPLPDKSQMIKKTSKDGKSYLWLEKDR